MKARNCNGRTAFESLEGRSLMSAVAYADFNNDGRVDMAAVTSPTTITVSLANPDGTYTVSAILTAPKNQPINDVGTSDSNGDGNQDVYAGSPPSGGQFITHIWQGNGDGTFGARTTDKWRWPKGNHGFF